ncbi:MAG: DUF2378 family protein [Myxococcota bacterium]
MYAPIDWEAELDVRKYVRAVPSEATLKGFFPAAVKAGAVRQGKMLPSARNRYVAFRNYPMSEHVQLLAECAEASYPDLPPREALRRIGWYTMRSLDQSVVGRVFRQFLAAGIEQTMRGLEKMYPMLLPPATLHATWTDASNVILRYRHVYAFVDCHHIGILERMFKSHSIVPEVQVLRHGIADLDVRCRW